MKVNKLKTGGELAQVAFPHITWRAAATAGRLTKTGYRLKSDRPNQVFGAQFFVSFRSPMEEGPFSSVSSSCRTGLFHTLLLLLLLLLGLHVTQDSRQRGAVRSRFWIPRTPSTRMRMKSLTELPFRVEIEWRVRSRYLCLYAYVRTHVCAVKWTCGKILAIKVKRTNEKMLEFLRYVATK